MGLTSINLSGMANWPDDVAVANVTSNAPLSTASLTPQRLVDAIETAITSTPTPAIDVSHGVLGAAERIAHHVQQVVLSGRASMDP